MLINTCTVLQSSLCSICLFGRKDSIFVTFKERLMEKNLSCWLCVGDISRVFIIKLSAFAKRYHTGLSSVSPQVLLCYPPQGVLVPQKNPERILAFDILSTAVIAIVRYV